MFYGVYEMVGGMVYDCKIYIAVKEYYHDDTLREDYRCGAVIGNVYHPYRRTGYSCVCDRGNGSGIACFQYFGKLAYCEQFGCET